MPEQLELPAYARSLGVTLTGQYEGGMPVLAVDFGPMVEGRPQHFHGGATAGLLEAAGYAALGAALLAGPLGAAKAKSAPMRPDPMLHPYAAAWRSMVQHLWATAQSAQGQAR